MSEAKDEKPKAEKPIKFGDKVGALYHVEIPLCLLGKRIVFVEGDNAREFEAKAEALNLYKKEGGILAHERPASIERIAADAVPAILAAVARDRENEKPDSHVIEPKPAAAE